MYLPIQPGSLQQSAHIEWTDIEFANEFPPF